MPGFVSGLELPQIATSLLHAKAWGRQGPECTPGHVYWGSVFGRTWGRFWAVFGPGPVPVFGWVRRVFWAGDVRLVPSYRGLGPGPVLDRFGP